MKLLLAGGLILMLGGCVSPMGGWSGANSSTPTDFLNAAAKDPASACFIVSTPYGGIQTGRAVVGAEVTVSGGQCIIKAPAAK